MTTWSPFKMKVGDLVRWDPIDGQSRYGLVISYDHETWLCTVIFHDGIWEIEEMYLEKFGECG